MVDSHRYVVNFQQGSWSAGEIPPALQFQVDVSWPDAKQKRVAPDVFHPRLALRTRGAFSPS